MTKAWLVFCGFCLLPHFANAFRYGVPAQLPGRLILHNSGTLGFSVYQKNPVRLVPDHPEWEHEIHLNAGESFSVEMKDLATPTQFTSDNSALHIFWQDLSGELHALSEGIANRFTSEAMTGDLVITNLSQIAQDGELWRGDQAQPFHLEAGEVFRQTLSANDGDLRIEGGAPLNAYVVETGASIHFLKAMANEVAPKPGATGVLFLLSNSSRSFQFIARIEDPTLIAAARAQLQNPNSHLGRILVAEITAGSNHENMNLLSPYRTWWSWHVSKVLRFADLASQSCDGNPDFLQDVLPAWLGGAFTGAQPIICFWSYRIVDEL